VKTKNIIAMTAIILSLLKSSIAYCDNGPSYEDTVKSIKVTMASSTSDARKESYNYIRFNKCIMDYNVLGTYPVGDLYNIKFSNIDFSSFNYKASRTGHDYTAFIILNFDKPLHSKGDFVDLTIRTLVVNVSNDEKAQLLFKAFSDLGDLCGTPKDP
jgi:hypothetical protein